MTPLPTNLPHNRESVVDDRTCHVSSDISFLRGYRETVYKLRCFGRGVCTIGEGNPSTHATEIAARRYGREWVRTGVAPADQGRGK